MLYRGEKTWVIIFRAIAAIILITGIMVYAAWNVVFEPIQAMWLVPSGIFRASQIPSNAISSREQGWHIFLVSRLFSRSICLDLFLKINVGFGPAFSVDHFHQAVSVGAMWPSNPSIAKGRVEGCNAQDFNYSFYSDYATVTNGFAASPPPIYDDLYESRAWKTTIKFTCPSQISGQPKFQDNPYQTYVHPDFLISVDYSALNISRELGEIAAGPENFMQVILGLMGDDDDDRDKLMIQNTIPTSLIPGVNLVGMAEAVVRRQLTSNFGAMFTSVSANVIYFHSNVPINVLF